MLLCLVLITHYAYEPLASLYSNEDQAARVIFYVLRGMEGTILFGLVWLLAPRTPRPARYGVALACLWGMLEEAQTAICQLAVGITGDDTHLPFQGLCDVVTGWPIYMGTVSAALILAALRFRKDKTCPPP